MSALTDSIINYFETAQLPSEISTILNSYTFQFGLWEEEESAQNSRYFIIQQNGGAATDIVLEQPYYTLYVIGKEREGFLGFVDSVGEVADSIVKYLKTNRSNDCYALIKELNQPTGPSRTTGNRPFYIINIRTITRG